MVINDKVMLWIKDDLEKSKEMLERFSPEPLDSSTGLDCHAVCKQLVYIGGDYYDFFKPDNKPVFVIGDVSGKGISAALMMSNLRVSLRNVMNKSTSNLVGVMSQLNRLVYESSPSARFITFFLAKYDVSNSRLSYVNAGHNPPLLFRFSSDYKKPKELSIPSLSKKIENLPIGMLDDVSYTQGSETLGKGDIIVAYTDGITEIQNSLEEEWGVDNLVKVIEENGNLSSKELVEKVFENIKIFADNTDSVDDMTLVILKALP
jgi:phosphoserine phosphatase RsbU/P